MGTLLFTLRVTRLVDWVFVHIFFSLAYTSAVVGLFWGHDAALGLACLSGISFLSLGLFGDKFTLVCRGWDGMCLEHGKGCLSELSCGRECMPVHVTVK
jgi:hypothetical protein